jgi:hypothetical protein
MASKVNLSSRTLPCVGFDGEGSERYLSALQFPSLYFHIPRNSDIWSYLHSRNQSSLVVIEALKAPNGTGTDTPKEYCIQTGSG